MITLLKVLPQYHHHPPLPLNRASLDATTKAQLTRGVRLVETLKQGQFNPLEVTFQIAYIYWGVSGFLDTKPVPYIKKLQVAASQYWKRGDRGRTNIDVIEHLGEW